MARANNVPMHELVERLRDAPIAWVRLAAERLADDSWTIRALDVITGRPPPAWMALRWEYARAVLLAFEQSGKTVGGWLAQRTVRVDGLEVDLGDLGETLAWERRESRWTAGTHEPLDWPSVEWQLPRMSNPAGTADELIAENAPSFTRLEVAVRCLLAGDGPTWNPGGREFVVRMQDLRGRIERVRVRPTQVETALSGEGLEGTILELAGLRPGPQARVTTEADRVVLPIADRLPDAAWLLLRSGSEWLDRRVLEGIPGHDRPRDVEFEVPSTTRLESLVAQGEGPTSEFKEALPAESEGSKRGVLKTVGAFANGQGGIILFGVTDEGEIKGLQASASSPKARDRLAELVRSWVSPLVDFSIDVVVVGGNGERHVLMLTVTPGNDVPYGVGTTPSTTVFYVRRGATSFPVSPSEVGALVRARSQQQPVDPFRFFGKRRA